MKKIVSLFLTLLLLMSCFAVALPLISAEGSEDYVISVDESIEVFVDEDSCVYVKFIPEETGKYEFYSDCEKDTYVFLLDEEFDCLSEDDDGGDGLNFKISFNFISGETYYFKVVFYDSYDSGTISVTLEKACEHLNARIVEEVPSSCTEPGYSCGVYCDDCESWVEEPYEIDPSHVDENKDHICDVCGEDAYKAKGYLNEDETVEYTLYFDGEMLISGTGEIEYMCYYYDVTSVTIENGITALPSYMFEDCENLKEVVLPEGLTAIPNGCFAFCESLSDIQIPSSVKTIDDYAFYLCTSLEGFDFSNVDSVGAYALHGTPWFNSQPDGLIYIDDALYGVKGTLPENSIVEIQEGTTSINSGCFSSQYGLAEVIIPEGVTYLPYGIFDDCSNLSFIVIPKSVTRINENILSGTNLSAVGYTGSAEEWQAITVESYWDDDFSINSLFYGIDIQYNYVKCEHTHTTNVAEVPPTCSEYGYAAGVHCDDCGRWLSGHKKLSKIAHTDKNLDSICDVCEFILNQPLDFVFVIDTTGSMEDDINQVKEDMKVYLSELKNSFYDYRVAIVDYRDFPERTGYEEDYPYAVHLDFTSDDEMIVDAINSLSLGYGGDENETVYSALVDGLDELSWRRVSTKTAILMGDAPALDPEPYTGYTAATAINKLLYDVIDFTAIDVEKAPMKKAMKGTLNKAIAENLRSSVTLFSISTSYYSDTIENFKELSEGTGGKLFTAAKSESISSIVESIIVDELPTLVTSSIQCDVTNVTVKYGDPITLTVNANVPANANIVWSADNSKLVKLTPSEDGLSCVVEAVKRGNTTIRATIVDENGNAMKTADDGEATVEIAVKTNVNLFLKIIVAFRNIFKKLFSFGR